MTTLLYIEENGKIKSDGISSKPFVNQDELTTHIQINSKPPVDELLKVKTFKVS